MTSDLGWYMDGHLPWRLAFLDDALEHATKFLHDAEEMICRLRKEGHKKHSPEMRAARFEVYDRINTRNCIIEARELLAPMRRERCSQGWRSWPTPAQMVVLRAADTLRGWDPVTGLWPRRVA